MRDADIEQLAPAMVLSTAKDDKEMGDHCLEYTHPDFREQVRNGQQIVVAGKAFGVGSSREEAVRALMGRDLMLHQNDIKLNKVQVWV